MSYELLQGQPAGVGHEPARRGAFHVDTFDLYSARQRAVFVKQASEELGVKEEVIHRDLGHVLLRLEAMQRRANQARRWSRRKRNPRWAKRNAAAAMQAAARSAPDGPHPGGLRALRHGGRGDEQASGYLAVVSRLLDQPLAMMVQSSSAAGKSSLMEAVLDFCRKSSSAVLGHDRAVAVLHGREQSEAQDPRRRRRRRAPRAPATR